MNLQSMIDERLVAFDLCVSDKEDAIDKVVKMLYDAQKITDLEVFKKGVLEREEEFSTGVGNSIAIPHCMSEVVQEGAFTLVRLMNEIEWGSLDDLPVKYIIMLAAPKDGNTIHLKMLSTLAMKLMDDDFRIALLQSSTIEEIKTIFNKKGE